MPSIEPRDVDEEQPSLEDLLTATPLLRASTTSTEEKVQSTVTFFSHKPNVHVVRPIPRPVPVKEDVLAELEAQIHRPGHAVASGSSSQPEGMKKSYSPTVVVIPKKKLIPMDPVLHKPLFITTVPSGVFLEKCPDSGEARKVYNYSSAPRVLRCSDNVDGRSFLNKVSSSSCFAVRRSVFYSEKENRSQKGMR